jgi:hypothetical protein
VFEGLNFVRLAVCLLGILLICLAALAIIGIQHQLPDNIYRALPLMCLGVCVAAIGVGTAVYDYFMDKKKNEKE